MIVTLEASREDWINLDKFNSKGFFDKVRMMSGLYLLLWAFGFQINYQWNNWLWRSIFDTLVTKFDSNYFLELQNNIEANWFNSTILIISMPGTTCEEIGTRIGLITRRLSGVSI